MPASLPGTDLSQFALSPVEISAAESKQIPIIITAGVKLGDFSFSGFFPFLIPPLSHVFPQPCVKHPIPLEPEGHPVISKISGDFHSSSLTCRGVGIEHATAYSWALVSLSCRMSFA